MVSLSLTQFKACRQHTTVTIAHLRLKQLAQGFASIYIHKARTKLLA